MPDAMLHQSLTFLLIEIKLLKIFLWHLDLKLSTRTIKMVKLNQSVKFLIWELGTISQAVLFRKDR